MQSNRNAKETRTAAERAKQIAQLESEIEAKRAEIDQLRINDLLGGQESKDVEENRDELNEAATHFESASYEDSFGEIIVILEQPVADEDRGGLNKIAIGKDQHVPGDGSRRPSTNVKTPTDMVHTASYASDGASVASTEKTPNPPSPRSPAGFFDHFLRPFTSPGNKMDVPSPPPPRQTGGPIEHLLLPLKSPGNDSESSTESEVLKELLEQRAQKIESLQETISSDTKVMRKMKETIERLSIELLSAKQSEKMFKATRSRNSWLEDEIEELRVENTKLRISSQMLEEEKRRIEEETRTELELLHLETGRHTIF